MVNRIIIILYKILRKIIIFFGVPLHFSSDGEDFILQKIFSKLKNGFEKINYHKWNICAPACKKGISLNIPIYKFLKNALIRKFGTDWYNLLTKIVEK